MGVPKFYRWISERYPCLSEVVREFQIPDFDNLYLDMNGIIHVCSHPNDDDPHFRITEEEIFQAICYYIDFLFKMIKPNKVFFMAIDGVAPRAKMNQQRGRRFRTAKSANDMEDQAKALGEVLPTEARFDSNCITPGTPFMARLHSCLQGFVSYKITTDKLWQSVRVYLSGHETPGEGEHKIMDFIRYEKSQPGFNPNTRHCLYGLDADLIMLGLCSHEPHFSLLREEVKFGGGSKKKQKRIATPEETTFHLLHISLLRDYLNHEFSPVKSKISFPFDLEQIIDDFVLMSFLVGNDFIPHLPQLHIHHDALPMLFQTYMDVLPSLGGYINEKGYLNLERFQKFLTKLAEYDFKKFGETSEDFEYLERKSKARKDVEEKSTANFLANLGFSDAAINEIAEFESSSDEDNIEEETTLELEFSMHKSDYYRTKLELESTPEVLKDQAEGYVRAIQWNLHYYYNGCMSWSWYYPHHYSPYISDVKDFKDMELKFDLGKPFLPFQQLLAVLPKLSKDLLPESYQKLMCDEDSPLIDFYPDAFMTDLNGKQQEWEAVVLIPFINEKLLVKFAEMADKDLNEDERKRNAHGPHLLYTYSEKPSGPVPSFLPKHYPSLSFNHAKLTKIDADFFRLPADSIYKGLCQGVVMDKFLIGFPTLKTLKHSANLRNAKVKVFQMTSLKENMMLHIEEPTEEDMNKLCEKMLGKIVYIGWPHLREAVVVSISDGKTNYASERDRQAKSIKVVEENMDGDGKKIWDLQVKGVEEQNYQRWGIVTGDIKVLVHVRCFSGSKFIISKEGKVTEDKQFEGIVSNFPLQTIVPEVKLFSPVVKEDAIAEEVFKSGAVIFALAPQHYGSMGKVVDGDVSKNNGMVLVNLEVSTEPDLWPVIENKEEHMLERFIPGYVIAQRVGVESHFVSRMTGTFLVQTSPKGSSSPNRANIGLNLKFNRKNEEVQGFSKKIDNQWLYSEEVAQILNEYLSKFADFFERLHKYLNSDVVYCEDLYPNGEGPNTVKEIAAWLKEQSCSLADRQTCGMKKLDHGIVAAIERAVENTINDEIYHVKKSIPPNHLHCPYFCRGVFMPDLKAKFNLFDRVVNVSPSSSVPLGLKGTVIGIQSAEKDSDYIYEIFFDKEFYGGFAIGFTSKKGYRMPPNSLINLSFGNKSKKSQSPSRSARNSTPKLLKNHLFDSALKNLPQVSSNIGHPKNSTPITIQKKPFYKADSIDLFSNLSQDPQYVSPVFSPNWSGNKQFVTPTVSGGFNGSPNNMQQKNASIQSEFQNLWVNMKKNPESPVKCAKPKASPVKSRSPKPEPVKPQAEQTYGQKLSVEELFQVAQNQNQIEATHQLNVQRLQNITLGPQATIETKAPDLLREFCLDYYKAPPLFTYNNFGNTALYVATITLPSGMKVSSIPCPSKFDAAGNASGKALAYCQSLPKRPTSSPNLRHKTDVRPQDSFMNPALLQHLPPSFQPEYQPFQFPYGPPPFIRPPGIGQQPPMGYPPPFPPACFEPPIMRHPPPMHSSNIPDSFVRANQVMYGEPEPQTMRVKTQNPDPKDKIGDKDVIHLPGGVTAMIRNSKGSDTNMFVPAQVMKNAIKTPHDAPLSNNEWPNLPNKAPDNNVPPQTVSPKVERTKPNSSPKPKTESNNVKETHPKGMTVLKPKSKRRIAANFQNPTTE